MWPDFNIFVQKFRGSVVVGSEVNVGPPPELDDTVRMPHTLKQTGYGAKFLAYSGQYFECSKKLLLLSRTFAIFQSERSFVL